MTNEIMVITGSSKGIGRYLTEHYTSLGMKVYGCSRGASDFVHENYSHTCLDVTDEVAVGQMFKEIRKTHKRLDVLINNAGIFTINHTLLTPISSVRKILETNVLGTYLFSREAAKLMKKNNYGRIVNFSSLSVPLKLAGESIYAASKAAVVSLAETMARDFASLGITVNTVGPPVVKTEIIKDVSEADIKHLLEQTVLPRFAEPEEVRNVIDFFISPASGMITGQTVYLGGV